MKKLAVLLSFSVVTILLTPIVSMALSGAPVVIEEVQAGTTNYRHEFIALRNRTENTIHLNTYSVAVYDSRNTHVVDIPLTGSLVPYGVLHVISEPYLSALESEGKLSELDYMSFQAPNSNALASGGGYIAVHDAGVEVDRLGYGDASIAEGSAAPAIPGSASLKRCTDMQGLSVDTNDNSVDFYLHDTPLDGLPGEPCVEYSEPPKPPCNGVVLSEILPNPSGADTGKEFIEIHNPTDSTIVLDGCRFMVGNKDYDLPTDMELAAGGYAAFYDSETQLTLPNSAGGTVTLLTVDTEEVVQYPGGLNDDTAWALVDGKWQETRKLTPNVANELPVVEQPAGGRGGGGGLAPCPDGKYRHPDTNRCRNIEAANSLQPCREGQERNPATNRCRSVAANSRELTPCKAGQERNPETNRCRSVAGSTSQLVPCKPGQERNPDTNRCRSTTAASSSLKPCNPDQFRNPETNRCKKIDDGSSSLKPCKEGQERNPETNRCRKIRETAEPAFAVEETPPGSGGTHYGWWLAGAAGTGMVGYGMYEWRREIMNGFRRLSGRGAGAGPGAN